MIDKKIDNAEKTARKVSPLWADCPFTYSKYFFDGVCDGDEKLYGLYSPVCDCFLLLSSDTEVLELLVYLMFTRIKLMVIRIDSSPNYDPKLISNWCSTNWTWSELGNSRVFEMPSPNNIFYENSGELISCTSSIPDKKLVQLMFFAYYVVEWFKSTPGVFYHKVCELIDFPFSDKFTELKKMEKNCYRLIYTCTDYRDIESQVLDTLVPENFQSC